MVSIIQKGNGLDSVFQEEVRESFRFFSSKGSFPTKPLSPQNPMNTTSYA
jgi:hypothetical protein